MKKNVLIISILLLNFTGAFGAEAHFDYQDDLQFLADVEAIETQMIAQKEAEGVKKTLKRRVSDRKNLGLESMYKCPHCKVNYSGHVGAASRYTQHIKKFHPGEKIEYQCPKCTKSFSKPARLIKHIKTH